MKKKSLRCISRLVLTLFIIAGLFCSPNMASAYQSENVAGTDICVVYDNSGSTFLDETWCHIKYALEILASMVDYSQGARLLIYPICEVSVDDQLYGESKDPIIVESYADIDKISNILTTNPGMASSFDSIRRAYQYLQGKSSAENKQLIILSDGIFDVDGKDLERNFKDFLENGITNIHYITINFKKDGNGIVIPSLPDPRLYLYAITNRADLQELKGYFMDLCNDIFNQEKVEGTAERPVELTLNSSGKIIVITQGSASNTTKLTDSDSNSIPAASSPGVRKYSTISAVGYPDAPPELSLASCITVYLCNDEGKYIVECQNTGEIEIYIQTDSEKGGLYDHSTALEEESGIWLLSRKVWIPLCLLAFLGGIVCLIFYFTKHRKGKEHTAVIDKENYVFISYSSKNKESAESIKYLLEKNGISTWIAPNDIPGGSKYAAVISGAIKNCSCFLVLLTQNSLKSPWVPKEVERAVNYGKPIVPVQLEELTLNDEFELYISTNQVIPIVKLDETSEAVKKLICSLKLYV